MRHTMIMFLALMCIYLFLPFGNKAYSTECLDRDALNGKSSEELISMLSVEYDMDEMVKFESDLYNVFDVVVGELIRRKDPESIPLLIEKINENVVVKSSDGKHFPQYRNNSPVRVKHKVRYVLSGMLNIVDYREMVGADDRDVVDEVKALQYFIENKEAIVLRMIKKSEYDYLYEE